MQGSRGGAFDVGWWCRELRTLLLAGMTAVEAIETLAAGRHDPVRERVHASLLKSLREGQALSRAMSNAGAFPEVLVASVMASERTSTLPSALEDYLRYDGMLRKLRSQLVSAAIYPAVVVTLGAAICLFLLLFVVPRFSRMYADLHGPVSAATRIVLWVSETVQHRWPLLVAGAAGVVVLALALWRSGALRRAGAALVEAIPPLERQWREFRLAKLYQAMTLMIKGGYAFDEALQVCAGLDAGPFMARRLQEVRTDIARGRSASAALASAPELTRGRHRAPARRRRAHRQLRNRAAGDRGSPFAGLHHVRRTRDAHCRAAAPCSSWRWPSGRSW